MSKERDRQAERPPARERRLEEIFDAALDVAPEDRPVFLDRACSGDHALRRELEELLEAQGAGGTLSLLDPGMLAISAALADLHPSLRGLSLAPGMQIGRYEIIRLLGRGGMGTVFLAHDTRLRRRIALKLLHAVTPEMTGRFLAEARSTARCKHENIVVIHDVDELHGRPCIILEYLEGAPLRARLAGPPAADETASASPAARRHGTTPDTPAMPVGEALALIIPVVRALACAHAHGIVHRDLKPENVFLCRDGTVKVLDFGIAKSLADARGPDDTTASRATSAPGRRPHEHAVTAQGALLGTVPYMSPEQWGAGDIDERTDVWAVGIMLYEMLAGRHPLSPLSYRKIQQQVANLDLPMPGIDTAVPGLGKLAGIVDDCLRKRKDARMHSAGALLAALEEVRGGRPDAAGQSGEVTAPAPEPARTASQTPIATPRPRRPFAVAAAVTTLGLAALMLLALWPRLAIPALPGTSGGIVLAVHAGAGDALLRTHRTLCAALRALDTQTVRCVELPRFGSHDPALLRAASAAGASLVARLEGDHDLRLLPVHPTAEILSALPALQIASAETRQHLAGILYPLSRVLAGDRRFDVLRAPPVTPDTVGWRLATLAWYLNVLARNQQAIPPADIRQTMTRCRQEASIADAFCALAHYVYAQLDPTPPDARHWLEAILAHGPPAFTDPVIIELAMGDCTYAADRAEAALLRVAAGWTHAPCRLVTLIGPATCLLTRHPQASEALQPIAYPGEDVLARCEADLVAAALAERGQWNMLARRWPQATRDLDAAWRHGNHPVDLLNWAESLLHQRGSGIDVATPIAAALDLRYFDQELGPLAAFLRWLATRDAADAANILRLYGGSPDHASVLVDDEGTLAALVCANADHAECRVYRILARPRQPGTEDELRRLLLAGDER